MSALQQAAFRGNYTMCEYLLNKGADVNHDKHENQYTTLMFAALSGLSSLTSRSIYFSLLGTLDKYGLCFR